MNLTLWTLMRAFTIFILFICTTLSSSVSHLDPEKLILIDNLIEDYFIPVNHIPGVSLSIVQNGEIILSKGYGMMNIENGLSAQNDTLYAMGSISKSFIATLTVKYLSEIFPNHGEGILDVPIIDLTANFNFTFSDRFRSEQISFRDLLSHRTCLKSEPLSLTFGTLSSPQEYTYRSRYESQACTFRNGFRYNDAMFALAGELIANFAGKSTEDMVRDFMLEIGMENATTIDSRESYEEFPNMSQGYFRKDDQTHKFNMKLLRRIDIGLGAGGILATSNDMAKYMNFHLNKGRVGNKQVVSEEAMSWLYKVSNSMAGLTGKETEDDSVSGTYGYGLGFFLALHDGYSTMTHSGFWPPFHSDMTLYPAHNIGVFLVSNGPGFLISSTGHSSVNADIFDILIGANRSAVANFTKKNIHFPFQLERGDCDYSKNINDFKSDTVDEIKLEDALGHYGNAENGDLRIILDSEDNQFLQLNFGEWGIGRLLPIQGSTSTYSVEWKTDIFHDFYTYPLDLYPIPVVQIDFGSGSGVGQSLDMVYDGRRIKFVRNATLDTFPAIPWDPTSCS